MSQGGRGKYLESSSRYRPFHILVISMDSALGEQRRSCLNYPYVWLEGVRGKTHKGPIRDRMIRYPGGLERSRDGMIGCFAAHVKALITIQQRRLKNVIICEDDAIQVRALPALNKLKRDGVTLLAGAVRTPGPWKQEDADFRTSGEALRIVRSFKPGSNIIDWERFRFTGSAAYFVPDSTVAQTILDRLSQSSDRITHWDVWLGKQELVKYLLYPNCFTERKGPSQIGTAAKNTSADRYLLWPELLKRLSRKRSRSHSNASPRRTSTRGGLSRRRGVSARGI